VKRAEFIKTFADSVAAGRRRNFPDMKPSEEAVARMSDEKRAAAHWRKHGPHYKLQTVGELLIELTKVKTEVD
jgi:hypothetical protein